MSPCRNNLRWFTKSTNSVQSPAASVLMVASTFFFASFRATMLLVNVWPRARRKSSGSHDLSPLTTCFGGGTVNSAQLFNRKHTLSCSPSGGAGKYVQKRHPFPSPGISLHDWPGELNMHFLYKKTPSITYDNVRGSHQNKRPRHC